MTKLDQASRIAPLVVMLALTIGGSAQVIPAAGAPPGPRTGMIVGQVVDAATGDPVGEAIVRLTMPKYFENPATPKDRVMADGEGRFFFSDLPAGEYFLQATKDGYAPGTHGERRAWGQSQLLSLAEGERPTDITLRVWKYGVIAGTVVDEAGEPAAGVTVRALIKDVVAGRTRYGNMQVIPELVPATTTDDRGMFRLSQLMPGTYVVLVPSTQTTVPAVFLERSDVTVRSDLFFAGVAEVSLLGQPRTQQAGDVALLTLNRVLIPPPSSGRRMAVYPTTYFPAAATAGVATPITLEGGEERTDIMISLRPVPAVRLSGRLVAPDGSVPPPTTIRLLGAAMTDVITTGLAARPDHVGLDTVTGMSDATGRFTLLGVPAGEYVLTQANRFLSRVIEQGQPAYWISQPVTVGADDLSDLIVALRPALRVEGRIEYRGGSTPQPAMAGITFETPFGEPGQFAVHATKGTTLTFSTVAAGGQYIARPIETGGWFVRSVTLRGKDITDRVFDLQADATSLVVIYTDRPSKVSGTVTDEQGSTSATAVVLVFPVDPQRWSGYGVSPRTLKSALTTRRGVYTVDHLPPGDYYAIAVAAADIDGWQDPATLEALATQATRLTVAADDSPKTLDLRVKAIR
jgi:hypothetical protein